MKLNAILCEKVSKRGNSYICVEISITETYKKIVFLDESEIALIKLAYANSNANK